MKSPSYQPPPSSSKPASVLPHKTPKLRDHYRIGKKLGQGQFGTTYLCIDKSDGKEYACKSMPKRKLICREDYEDVWREIQILHHLSEHPNVVRIKGAYEDAVFVHLVMELAAGGELFDRIIQDGHYSERKAAELIKTIVGVVEACHSLGVMHRDLKPENFLFASTHEDAALKATDFRLSVFYKPGDIFSDVVGSPYYVAPEVLHKYYGPEADVWSSGVILYILLSGIPPFWAETEAGIFRQILQGPLDFESEPWPCISDSAKDLIRNMLNRDPKKRFTAHQVLSHPWIVDAGVAADKPSDSAVLSRLKQFSAMNKLKKLALRGDQSERPPHYKHIERNEFSYRKHVKQKEEDIAICVCQYDTNDPDSACGERCLNVLTSTECTPGYCPCGNYCRNQKFQKCEYAKSRLFRTEGRGWGLLADENIKAGKFIIEYCGVVISSKEAKRRSQTYETAGLQDAYIIFLNAQESIDATRKGNLARFINHSCQPNCETRKWTVLGEVRVGIFAKHDIPIGTELAYDYNFEWYGGAKVRCLCGADCCSGFLGAKSRGFQEATHVWEDGDDRYSVEDIPIYNSEDDEPTSQLFQAIVPSKVDSATVRESEIFIYNADGHESLMFSDTNPISVEPLNSVPMDMDGGKFGKRKENSFYPHDAQQKLKQKGSLMSRIRSNSACRNYQIQSNSVAKNSLQYSSGKSKIRARKEFSVTQIGECLLSKDARDDLLAHEEAKNLAKSRLDSLYDEIRPAIEEHERDSQESVPTSVAERWIEASCSKLKAELDLSVSLIKSILCNHRRPRDDANFGDGLKYLENGQ